MFRPHYAWAVLAAATLLIFCQGLVTNGFAVYLPYLREGYEITNTQSSLLSTMRCATALAAMLLVNAYYRRFSLRLGAALALVMMAAGFAVCGLVPTYLGSCVGSAAMGLACGFGAMVPASMLVHRWFAEERALALGICTAGSGLSSVFAAPLVTLGASTVGVHLTFVLEAAAVLALGAVVYAVVRDNPAPGGAYTARHDGGTAAENPSLAVKPAVKKGSPALGTKGVATMFAVVFAVGAVASPAPAHYGLLFEDAGIGSAAIAGAIMASGLSLVVGKLAYGALTEKMGAYRTNRIFFGLLVAGLLSSLLLAKGGVAVAFLLVVLCGFGLPPATAGTAVWASDLNEEHYDRTVQTFQVAYVLGNLVGMPVPGIVADLAGSYVPVFAAYALLMIGAFAVLQLRYRASGLAPAFSRRALKTRRFVARALHAAFGLMK